MGRMYVGYHIILQLKIRTSQGGHDVGYKGTGDLIFNDQQYSLNSHQCQRSSHVGIGQHEWVFSNQTMHYATILQEIWSEVVATLKIQYDGITSGFNTAERQRLAFM